MARAQRGMVITIESAFPPVKPSVPGALLNADPSGAVFAENIHRFSEPSSAPPGDDAGYAPSIRSTTARSLRYFDPQRAQRERKNNDE